MTHGSFRSPIARALGLGSAKKGSQQWWAERVTALALAPLTLWYLASTIGHTGSDYAVFTAWLRTPFATGCMIMLPIALFHHTALGLQMVIEDYVHSGAKFVAVLAVRLCCYALAVFGIIATLRVALAVETAPVEASGNGYPIISD